jgi:hypothetical protein
MIVRPYDQPRAAQTAVGAPISWSAKRILAACFEGKRRIVGIETLEAEGRSKRQTGGKADA